MLFSRSWEGDSCVDDAWVRRLRVGLLTIRSLLLGVKALSGSFGCIVRWLVGAGGRGGGMRVEPPTLCTRA